MRETEKEREREEGIKRERLKAEIGNFYCTQNTQTIPGIQP